MNATQEQINQWYATNTTHTVKLNDHERIRCCHCGKSAVVCHHGASVGFYYFCLPCHDAQVNHEASRLLVVNDRPTLEEATTARDRLAKEILAECNNPPYSRLTKLRNEYHAACQWVLILTARQQTTIVKQEAEAYREARQH
jgi:hypothetical protein